MRIVIFTRTGFHHTCFINRLQERFPIACVVRESYPEIRRENIFLSWLRNIMEQKGAKGTRDSLYLKRFHEMYSAGFRYNPVLKDFLQSPFDVLSEKQGTQYVNIRCGEINAPEFSSFITDLRPDIVAVLGSSVIKPHIISAPSIAMINLHSGLSPYYRGTWSYGWPLVNSEPEYIGATVHHINQGIDTGDIIYQTRPVLDDNDDLNTIFLKVISEGIELAADALENILKSGSVGSFSQPSDIGRLYSSKDLNAEAARLCLSNLEKGAIRRYNENKRELDSRVRLYGYVPPRIFR